MQTNFKSGPLSTASASETALSILTWLASQEELLSRFLALTGLAPDQLRGVIDSQGFKSSLLDFVIQDEPTLLAFCEATDTRPETVVSAWQSLSSRGLDSGEY